MVSEQVAEMPVNKETALVSVAFYDMYQRSSIPNDIRVVKQIPWHLSGGNLARFYNRGAGLYRNTGRSLQPLH